MEHQPKEEFDAISENLRHLENLFFANVTVFITVNAGLATVAFGEFLKDDHATFPYKKTAILGGILFTLVTWINACIYLNRLYKQLARIVHLERVLQFKIHSAFEEHRWRLFRNPWLRPGGLSWQSLFLAAVCFWLLALYRTAS